MVHTNAAPHRGRRAEELAALFLELRGHRVLARNRRAAGGEIDLVTRHGNDLVFVEVRLRADDAWVGAGASIDARKRARLRNCARALSREEALRWPGRRIRFDVVLLRLRERGLELQHLSNVRLERRQR